MIFHGRETKRVLMVVENCLYHRDPRVRNEAESLTAAGYSVVVIAPGGSGEPWYEQIGTVKVYRFPLLTSKSDTTGYLKEYVCAVVSIMLLSVWVLFRDGFDIIHVANPPDCIVPIISIYRLLGKIVIYDQHDLCPELYEAKFGQGGFYKLLLCLERWSYTLANHVIVTNESYKEFAERRGGLRKSKVTVVRNGPDLRRLKTREVDDELRTRSPNIIAFAGTTGSQDGLDYLCHALHHLRYEMCREDFYCIVLGDGDALSATQALARQLGVEQKIWFAGWVSDPDVYARFISTADICVSTDPHNHYNNHSTFIKIMEYMAAGKPIVTFDLLETRRSAQEAALYADPNDIVSFAQRLVDLMANPSLRHSMGEVGYKRVQDELAWKYSAPRLLGAYKRVTNGKIDSSEYFVEDGESGGTKEVRS
jgi:glycosyltransferase involved in cell wall biosynthesis